MLGISSALTPHRQTDCLALHQDEDQKGTWYAETREWKNVYCKVTSDGWRYGRWAGMSAEF